MTGGVKRPPWDVSPRGDRAPTSRLPSIAGQPGHDERDRVEPPRGSLSRRWKKPDIPSS